MHTNYGFIWTVIVVLTAIRYITVLNNRYKKSPGRREALLKTRANASWAKCYESYYIFDFRKKLDEIAEIISLNYSTRVYTRFNGRGAEFLTARGGVLVSVNVHGECGCPYEVVITTPRISGQARMLFDTLMPGSVRFIEAPC